MLYPVIGGHRNPETPYKSYLSCNLGIWVAPELGVATVNGGNELMSLKTTVGKLGTYGLAGAIILGVAAPGAAFAADKGENGGDLENKVSEPLNIRVAAGATQDRIGTLEEGTTVTKLEGSKGKWWKVKANGKEGWLNSEFLDQEEKLDLYNTVSGLNFRDGAGFTNKLKGSFETGDTVNVTGKNKNGWWEVHSYEDKKVKTGWVNSKYLKKNVAQESGSLSGTAVTVSTGSTTKVAKGAPSLEKAKFTSKTGASVIAAPTSANVPKSGTSGLKSYTSNASSLMSSKFGSYISSIGGYRAGSVGHGSGRALDLMIKGYDTRKGSLAGDQIAEYLLANKSSMGIDYIIWRDRIFLNGSWKAYSGGGYGKHLGAWNDTTLHNDHIHVEFKSR